jgi:mRNA interferase HigB
VPRPRRHAPISGHETLREFSGAHAAARRPLARFIELAVIAEWKSLIEVKQSFPSVDYAPASGLLIFNIGGNQFRLTARVDFAEQILVIDSIVTHASYSKEKL